jgi:hypothetical protein
MTDYWTMLPVTVEAVLEQFQKAEDVSSAELARLNSRRAHCGSRFAVAVARGELDSPEGGESPALEDETRGLVKGQQKRQCVMQ